MTRSFTKVLEQIKKVAPEDLKEALERGAGFWAPEIVWYKLTEYVQRYVTPCSSDQTSVAVYAVLCNCTEADMKARFENEGL
jgi:hypothetical protein